MTDVYKKLAKHLDNLPAGYPSTESGVELRILKAPVLPGRGRNRHDPDHDARTGGGGLPNAPAGTKKKWPTSWRRWPKKA